MTLDGPLGVAVEPGAPGPTDDEARARKLRQWCIEQVLKWPVGEPGEMDYANVIDRASKVEEYVLNGKPQAAAL